MRIHCSFPLPLRQLPWVGRRFASSHHRPSLIKPEHDLALFFSTVLDRTEKAAWPGYVHAPCGPARRGTRVLVILRGFQFRRHNDTTTWKGVELHFQTTTKDATGELTTRQNIPICPSPDFLPNLISHPSWLLTNSTGQAVGKRPARSDARPRTLSTSPVVASRFCGSSERLITVSCADRRKPRAFSSRYFWAHRHRTQSSGSRLPGGCASTTPVSRSSAQSEPRRKQHPGARATAHRIPVLGPTRACQP